MLGLLNWLGGQRDIRIARIARNARDARLIEGGQED